MLPTCSTETLMPFGRLVLPWNVMSKLPFFLPVTTKRFVPFSLVTVAISSAFGSIVYVPIFSLSPRSTTAVFFSSRMRAENVNCEGTDSTIIPYRMLSSSSAYWTVAMYLPGSLMEMQTLPGMPFTQGLCSICSSSNFPSIV